MKPWVIFEAIVSSAWTSMNYVLRGDGETHQEWGRKEEMWGIKNRIFSLFTEHTSLPSPPCEKSRILIELRWSLLGVFEGETTQKREQKTTKIISQSTLTKACLVFFMYLSRSCIGGMKRKVWAQGKGRAFLKNPHHVKVANNKGAEDGVEEVTDPLQLAVDHLVIALKAGQQSG